jgi:D-xylose transport system permease protein
MTSSPTSGTAATSGAPEPAAVDEPATPAPVSGFEGDASDGTISGYARGYVNKVRGGDLGALPAVAGIVVLFVLFTALRPSTFPTPLNLTNLIIQAVPISLLAMGLVFVLLLGEIDLSAGVVSGVCAAVMAVSLERYGVAWYTSIVLAVVAGVVIGFFTGVLVSVVRIPSFVVTLALFLGWQGVTLKVVGQGGTIPVRNEVIVGLTQNSLSVVVGWVLAFLVIVLYALVQLNRWRVQRARNLVSAPLAVVLARIGVIAVVTLGAAAIMNVNRALNPNITLAGIPWAVPIVIVLLLILTFVLGRTSFGRHVYAVGGNSEASRRAGISTTRIRILVFALSSGMAAVSGIMAASRLSSVDPSSGGGNTLLYAVAAAVIGGTSLFGGRGRVRDALLGGLVIAIIDNGLGLLQVAAYLNFIITGLVLLLAASVDALARRRSAATGR